MKNRNLRLNFVILLLLLYVLQDKFNEFSVVPKGRHEIHVCTGTACHVRGAPRVLNAVQDQTGLKPGLTDQELRLSLETVSCVGCCALGPVMVVDEDYHGQMDPAKSEDVLKNYD